MAKYTWSATADFIANGKLPQAVVGDVLETEGYTTEGDGGNAQWQLTATTGTVSQSPAQLANALLNDANGNQWVLVSSGSVDVVALGADATGVLSSHILFLAAITHLSALSGGEITGSGIFKLDSDITRTDNTTIKLTTGSSFTGVGELLNSGVERLDTIPSQVDFGRLVVRDQDITPTHSDGFLTYPSMGQFFRGDALAVAGQVGAFLSNDQREPVISVEDYVCLHTRNNNSLTAPKLWGMNTVVVKNIDNATSPTGESTLVGMEISVSNNTSEAATPLVTGNVLGLFISYIANAGNASAAVAVGGFQADANVGWQNGIWIDGLKTDGRGIVLNDDVSANAGMRVGLDTTPTSSFSEGAIKLGNNHRINGLTTGGTITPLLQVSSANQIEIGATATPALIRSSVTLEKGTMELGASTTTSRIDFHGNAGASQDYDARITASSGSTTSGQGLLVVNATKGINIDGPIKPAASDSLDLGSNTLAWNNGYIKRVRTGDGSALWTTGAGTPEGVLTAVVGSMYTRTDGGAGTTLYIKESGTGNTGWVAK